MKSYSRLFVITILLTACYSLFGQDRVFLVNKNIVSGHVYHRIDDDSIYVKIAGDNGIFIPKSLISDMRISRKHRKLYGVEKNGMEAGTDTLFSSPHFYKRFVIGYNGGNLNYKQFGLYGDFIYGYKYNRFLNLGIKTGVTYFYEHFILPVGIYYEYDFSKYRDSPFVYSDIGYGFLISSTEDQNELDPGGGVNFSIGYGHKFPLLEGNLRISIGYLTQVINYERMDNALRLSWFPDSGYYFKRQFNRLTLKLGYTF